MNFRPSMSLFRFKLEKVVYEPADVKKSLYNDMIDSVCVCKGKFG